MSLINIALTGLVAAFVAGCASTPSAESRLADADSKTQSANAAKEAHCVRDTGSRIKTKDEDCAAFGRKYSKEELEQTGEIDNGRALRQLDPRIQ